mgnify:CR=1 FL=1
MKKLLLLGVAMAALAGTAQAADLLFKPGEDAKFNWASYDAYKKAHGDLKGETLTIFGPWRGEDEKLVTSVLNYFTEATGVTVKYSSSENYEQQIVIDTQAGSPPNIAILPQPGLLADLASKGFLVPLGDDTSKWVKDNYGAGQSWVDLGTYKGKDGNKAFFAFPYKADLKSLVWYSPENFKEAGYRVLGIDPSRAGEVARERGVETLTAYFGLETANEMRRDHGPAKLVTAANVFAHIGNVHDVIKGILAILADDGMFVSESHYLLSLVETLQYDTIYHEHLRYYDLHALKNLLEGHGLEIVRVKRIPTHGGSIRVYAARKGRYPVDASVEERLAHEDAFGLTSGAALRTFRHRVVQSKLDLHSLLAGLKRDGARIYGIGAPSRASTLVNYVGIDDGIVDYVLETSNSHKLNKYLPGTRIPVIDEARLFTDQPEYALLLSWHIAPELISNLRRKGYTGKFIVPLPEPHIVE